MSASNQLASCAWNFVRSPPARAYMPEARQRGDGFVQCREAHMDRAAPIQRAVPDRDGVVAPRMLEVRICATRLR